MGALWSRLRGKQTTYDILEAIDKDINNIQKSRKDNQDKLKNIVTRLIIYSVILYVIGAVLFFFLYLPETWDLRLLYSTPLMIFPFIIWFLKKLLHWYFVSRIAKNDTALKLLQEKKKQILEDVMETETYKKAKEILEKFDPSRFKKMDNFDPDKQGTPGTSIQQRKPSLLQQPTNSMRGTPIRTPAPIRPTMRQPLQTPNTRPISQNTPNPRAQMAIGRGTPLQQRMPMSTPQTAAAGRGMMMPQGFVPPPGPPMPRSVLPRDRGTMDKLMDYLVGDGPQNRYALVCSQCFSHNGMALKEEFEYLSFRCCYCYYLNPARKQRPFAPRMEFFNPSVRADHSKANRPAPSGSSEEDSTSEEEDIGASGSEANKADSVTGQASSSTVNGVEALLNKPSGQVVESVKQHLSFDNLESSEMDRPAVVEEPSIPLADAEEVEISTTTEDGDLHKDIMSETEMCASQEDLAVNTEQAASTDVPTGVSDGSDESFEQLSAPSDNCTLNTEEANTIDPNQNTTEDDCQSDEVVSASINSEDVRDVTFDNQ